MSSTGHAAAAAAGAKKCSAKTLKEHGFADSAALLAASKAGTQPEAVNACMLEGWKANGTPPPRKILSLSLEPSPDPRTLMSNLNRVRCAACPRRRGGGALNIQYGVGAT